MDSGATACRWIASVRRTVLLIESPQDLQKVRLSVAQLLLVAGWDDSPRTTRVDERPSRLPLLLPLLLGRLHRRVPNTLTSVTDAETRDDEFLLLRTVLYPSRHLSREVLVQCVQSRSKVHLRNVLCT